MKRVLIYPFGKESEYIVKFSGLLCEMDIVCLVSINGWGYDDTNYTIKDKNVPLLYDFEKALNCYELDIVWFSEMHKNLDFEKDYLPYLNMAIKANKKLILDEKVKELAQKYVENLSLYIMEDSSKKLQKQEVGNFLKQINTPLVYVCSLYEGLCKSELQLMIGNELKNRGIDCVHIGTKNALLQFGYYDMSEIICDKHITEKEKTILINWKIKQIEEEKKPKMIVVGVPGEMTFSTIQYVANFGYTARNYFMAAIPDVLLVNIPYGNYSEENLGHLSRFMTARYGVPVDMFCLTNKLYLENDTELEQDFTYLTLMEKDIKVREYPNLMCELKEESIEKIVDCVCEKLIKYAQVKSI